MGSFLHFAQMGRETGEHRQMAIHMGSVAPLRTVLVDDDDEIRGLLDVRLTSTCRFRVVAHGRDGRDAITLSREHLPDVLIVDHRMPVLTGVEAIREVVALPPRTTVVLYTSDHADELWEQARQAGAHAVVGKLAPFEHLAQAVERHRQEEADGSL
jgi:DNA-binding NarL/FixJ family response regulator